MKIFSELADRIEGRWRSVGYDNEQFPRLAADALNDARLPEQIGYLEVLQDLAQANQLTEQRDLPAGFSNLPITLENRPRFYLDLYLWLDGTTTIHQHSFSGAYQVLAGSSLHSRYRFNEQHRINEHFRLGEVKLESVESLNVGDVREIVSGQRFAHALFHLAKPSATITVRTLHDVSHLPQFDYLPPSIAINSFFSEPLMARRLQVVAFLLDTPTSDTDRMIQQLLIRADAHTAFLILSEINQRLNRPGLEQFFGAESHEERFAAFVAAVRVTHGELVDQFLPVFETKNRTAEIVRRRGQVTGDDQRFFLALLLNLPDRSHIFEMIRQRFPDADPTEQILEWVGELGRTRTWNSPEPNVLGLPDFDEDHLFVLETMLAGKTPGEIAAAVDREYTVEQAAALKPTIEKRCADFRRSPLFHKLLSVK